MDKPNTTSAPRVVHLQDVCKSFNVGLPNEIEILHHINFSLFRGEFCAVMGPSGSGKSTLLNIIGLLDRPTHGQLAITGEETTGLDDQDLTRLRGHAIGFVFQHHHLLNAFTALENVMMPLLGAAGFPNARIEARAAELLDADVVVLIRNRADGGENLFRAVFDLLPWAGINQRRVRVAQETQDAE